MANLTFLVLLCFLFLYFFAVFKILLSFGFLEETEKIYKPVSGRPAKLFQFNQKKYKELESNGFHFEIKFA